ncbi:hypothetical protein EPJ64_00350 [Brachyspira aalborgi]|jgi:predicted DNA-binding protein (UPF0251 family)|uniref:Uncharacterized protein n=1 Tax=Brachyspira aalborgi TaxID=29522 RepID=A0AB38Q1T6_9SPIR|nr:hypothetical protein [Brachyspira aalborgi]MBS4763552.1 hypothetical protein [Brachyspira sp.]CCY74401.1 putative uncharacterized protein [Brachyspira sp. CAG:700]TXJ17289.1 hypothetical protein EPJ77_00080 [Brachyspira aalborgi]TXJ22882.1 hypothetical protein EPJ64_00350 [Brachyspira aalborgi]TXJ26755.1 hypothetical protein EPJ73_03610 [Brachyspira aalborgi]
MGDIDKTRDRLKLDDIEEDDRRDLFNKFVDAGGEVVYDSRKKINSTTTNINANTNSHIKKNNSINTNSQSRFEHSDIKPKKESHPTNKQTNYEAIEKIKTNEVFKPANKSKPLFFNFKLWLSAFSSGVITFFGGKVNPKFLNFIDKNVISSLLEMDTLMFNALNPMGINDADSKNKREKIISRFATELEDVELLERIKDQYDEKVYKNLLRPYKELDSPVVAVNYVNELKGMFRPLYVLHLYSSKIKLVGEKAMSSYAIVDNMSKGIVNSRISAFKRAVELIYSKYYPKLLILLQYASKEKLETLEEFNRFLEITDVDILGYYTKLKLANQKIHESKIEAAKENIGKKDEEEKLNKIESIGVKLIEKCVSFKKEDNNIEYETDPFYTIEENDKIYRIKVLIDFLDREYSILFVSNKVKYNLVYDNLVRTDYKSDFNNIFLSLSDINSRFNEYSEICKNILKVEEDEAMRFEQRVSMLSERNGQRAYISKNLKSTVMSIINSFKKKLDKLLLDKEEREKIIANPNDILTLFADIGNHKKRVQGYNVLKALTEAYYFISGFNYLITEGELSGAGILIDKAEEIIEENIEEKDDKEDKKEEEIKENEETKNENNEYNNEVNNTEENEKEINNDKEENIDTLVSDNIDEDVKDM